MNFKALFELALSDKSNSLPKCAASHCLEG